MAGKIAQNADVMSLPVRGAWIEIVRDIVLSYVLCGRSPCGERGLKFLTNRAIPQIDNVAPRAGSVD